MLLKQALLLLSLTVSVWYMVDSMRLHMHPGIYNHPDWLTLKNQGAQGSTGAWRARVSKRKFKGPVGGGKEDWACYGRKIKSESLSRLFGSALWQILWRAFPSVLLSPWLVSASLVYCLIWVVAMGLVHRGPVIDHREQAPVINHTDEQHTPQEHTSYDGKGSRFCSCDYLYRG